MNTTADIVNLAAGTRTPPYIAFPTFITLIDDLVANGLPQRIDRSVLKRFAGGTASQLIMALKSLGLIENENRPTTALQELVKTRKAGEPDFKVALRKVIDASYPFLAQVDLTTITPNQFAEAFRDNTSAKEDILQKCRRFYLYAAKYVDIELGPRLAAASSAGTVSVKKVSGSGSEEVVAAGAASPRIQRRRPIRRNDPPPPSASNGPVDIQAALLAKFPSFDPSWDDKLKQQWFAGFTELMKRTEKKEE